MIREGVASVPPATVAALTLAGVSLQDWVLMATLGWLGIQIAYFFYQRYKEWKD
jgi:C4-dicarboxylate transporter